MFNKALFKQSCKANGTMWLIITCAVCFMLACVMLISGNGTIGEVKDSIQETIIQKEIDSQLEKRAINYYINGYDGLIQFDEYFTENAKDNLSYLSWVSQKPEKDNYATDEEYQASLEVWNKAKPIMTTACGKSYAASVDIWLGIMPNMNKYPSVESYIKALEEWKKLSPATTEKAASIAYTSACSQIQEYVYDKALRLNEKYTKDSAETQEMLGSVMYAINPNGLFNNFFTSHNEKKPNDYDVVSLVNHIASGDIDTYLKSEERKEYCEDRAETISAIFIAGNMTEASNVQKILEVLISFGVTEQKYNEFGYTYDSIKDLSASAVITYRNRLDYEIKMIDDKYLEKLENGEITGDEYNKMISDVKESLESEITSSLLTSLPDGVANALEEVGKADLCTLIVGSIFYKLAGLLLPIIYMIMAANNLIAGQVDSGSMAYILSTSTKRKTIVFTQAIYLLGSLLAMFMLTSVTGCICLSIVKSDVSLTYGKLILLNLGAFLVLFALSGLCFFTSCYFDRSKRSMAIGGGLSIFALVAAMLGLFGSEVIPSVVRLDSLNYFNYTTIISLFDVISIIKGSNVYIIKFVILVAMGLIGYILGSMKFIKKDLPL